jgi:hypothetical protein
MVDGVLPSKLLMGGIWENTRKDSWIMKVFISHAHTDEPLVKKVAAVLEDIGLEVWDDHP